MQKALRILVPKPGKFPDFCYCWTFENFKRNLWPKNATKKKPAITCTAAECWPPVMPVFAKLAKKWLFFDWRLLACDFVDFGIFKLVTLPSKSEPKQKKVKKSWGWGISFWGQNLAPEWLVVIESSATVLWLVLFALFGPKLGLFLDIWGCQTTQIAKIRSHAQTFGGAVTKVALFFTYWALRLK